MSHRNRRLLVSGLLGFWCALGGGMQSANAQALRNCASIMPLGDSITAGVNGGYRNDLYQDLLQDNCGVSFVGTLYDANARIPERLHEGHPFFTLTDIANGVDGWLAIAQPNTILLMAGTNDIAAFTNDNAEQIGARHDALVDRIQKARPSAWIFVASIPPQSSKPVPPTNVDRAVLTFQFNSVLRRRADDRARAGQSVRFVDVNAALSVDDLTDGIHPRESAQGKIADKFTEAIRAALKLGTSAVALPNPPPPQPSPLPSGQASASAPAAAATPAPAAGTAPAPAAAPSSASSGGAFPAVLLLTLLGLLPLRSRSKLPR